MPRDVSAFRAGESYERILRGDETEAKALTIVTRFTRSSCKRPECVLCLLLLLFLPSARDGEGGEEEDGGWGWGVIFKRKPFV